MTRLLGFLLRRTPIGWLQLTHNRARLVAAVAGIAFANLLVFVQLGVVASISSVIEMTYTPFRADIWISPLRPELVSGELLTRRVIAAVLADPAVADATPLYLGTIDWKRPDGSSKSLTVYAMMPEAAAFADDAVGGQLAFLKPPDRVLLDSNIPDVGRLIGATAMARLSPAAPATFEVNGHAVAAVGTFKVGSGFGADGALFVSDQTFMRLFPARTAGTPSHILASLRPGFDPAGVASRLNQRLASEHAQVRTIGRAIADDIVQMNTDAPMGIIFGFGVFVGILVGLVIVYQVLASDVAAHLKEYATFKAMGYSQRFLLGIVFEEAAIIAVLGFVPGILLGSAVYEVMAAATDLPIGMTASRALEVLVGTFLACAISGSLATLRLRRAEPADLF